MRGAPMGDFTDAIEPDDDHVYDICSGYNTERYGPCGDLKLPKSAYCLRCSGRQLADRMEAEWDAENLQRRAAGHAFYCRMVEENGWTPADIARHAIDERARRGDPSRPRFWSGTSIGRPKRQSPQGKS